MAIVIQCALHPYGSSTNAVHLATLTIRTTDDFRSHAFCAGSMAGCDQRVQAVLPKTRSAHRNLLHVLRDFLNAADLDDLGENYITTELDR